MICLDYGGFKQVYSDELSYCTGCKKFREDRRCPCSALTIKPLCHESKCRNNGTVYTVYPLRFMVKCLTHIPANQVEAIARESFRRTNMF